MKNQCDLCEKPKRYKYKLSLDTHVKKVHTKEIPMLPCNLCDRQFSTKGTLNKHTLWHKSIVRAERARELREQRLRNNRKLKPFTSLPARIIASKHHRQAVAKSLAKEKNKQKN